LALSQTTANQRLKEEIERIDATYDDIERETNISRNTWMRMTKPNYSIKIENVELLGDKFGIDTKYVLVDERSVPTSGSVPRWEQKEGAPTWAEDHRPMFKIEDKPEQSVPMLAHEDSELYNFDPSEFVSVPYYPNVYASGGQGLIAENEQSINMVFRSYFFNKTIQAAPANCFMLRIKGDSMSPVYNDGSDLLVDTARTKIKEGPGFIVRIEDVIYCKLLSKLPDGRVRLSSINKSYDPFEGTPGKDNFEIIGEVVWSASLSKFIF